MNITVAKEYSRNNGLLRTNLSTSNIFKSEADSDYEKKKEAEKKAIHAEIKRVSDESSEY